MLRFWGYQKEFDNYILRSLNHKMYLQLRKDSTVSLYEDKRFFESNIQSKRWC